MQIRGTPEEIAWIVKAITNGSDCDTCPIQKLCSTVYAIDARKGVPLSDCEDIIRKHLTILEQ